MSENQEDGQNEENECEGYQYSHFYSQHFHLPDHNSLGKPSIDRIHQEKWPNQQGNKSGEFKGRLMKMVSNQGSLRLNPKRAKVESIEMHGGRIFRSTGRKDKHSKVCTARGSRDRRVRLSPNAAIQFYDVQDRLGYDRPSKAIDWLMREAKAAIDALENDSSDPTTTYNHDGCSILKQSRNPLPEKGLGVEEESKINCSESACRRIDCSQEYTMNANDDSITTSINNFTFFSMENGTSGFQNYQNLGDFSDSRKGLSLSFHTIQDFSFPSPNGQYGLIPPPHCQDETNSEMGKCQGIVGWNSNSSNAKGSDQENTPANSEYPLHFPSHFDQNQILFHREPLQSSFSHPIRGPILDSQFPNLCFPSTRFASDGAILSELSSAARIDPGPDEQNPASSKLLHYQG